MGDWGAPNAPYALYAPCAPYDPRAPHALVDENCYLMSFIHFSKYFEPDKLAPVKSGSTWLL